MITKNFRKIFFAATFLLSTKIFAAGPVILTHDHAYLGRTSILNLDKLKLGNEFEITVSYPGKNISGVCGLEFRTSSNVNHYILHFLTKVSIENAFTHGDQAVISQKKGEFKIDLNSDNSYQDGVVIKGIKGESLSKIIKETLGDDELLVIPALCN